MTALTFVLWGVVPLYWKLLKHVPPLQIIAHRIVWCTLFVLGWLFLSVRFTWWQAIKATPGARLMLLGSSVAIALDWGLYIWAINTDHVIESSLGYFISPLLSVLLGVLLLKERLRGLQWLAVVCAALGVAWLTWQAGRPPWIALGLALSLSLYSLLRKFLAVDAVAG
ncbi:MAG TPA: EamA family transporter RarD, partial [Xylella taiwanensis]